MNCMFSTQNDTLSHSESKNNNSLPVKAIINSLKSLEGMLKSVRRVVAPQRSLSLSTQTLLFRAQNVCIFMNSPKNEINVEVSLG